MYPVPSSPYQAPAYPPLTNKPYVHEHSFILIRAQYGSSTCLHNVGKTAHIDIVEIPESQNNIKDEPPWRPEISMY
jgi:hypothetical protein